MTKAELFDFLIGWNQEDKAEGDYKPLNPYQLHALSLAPEGFYLKWYLTPDRFDSLAKELEPDFLDESKNRIMFKYSDQNVEIEKIVTEDKKTRSLTEKSSLSH